MLNFTFLVLCSFSYLFFLLLMLSNSAYQYSFADEDNVSAVAANLQELSIENHDKYSSHEEDRPAVLIPDHLLIYSEECSQLSFGSFGSRPLNNNLEEVSHVAPQIEHADARHAPYY